MSVSFNYSDIFSHKIDFEWKNQDDLPWITTVAPPHVPSCCDPGDISGNARFEVISVISIRQGRPHLFLHLGWSHVSCLDVLHAQIKTGSRCTWFRDSTQDLLDFGQPRHFLRFSPPSSTSTSASELRTSCFVVRSICSAWQSEKVSGTSCTQLKDVERVIGCFRCCSRCWSWSSYQLDGTWRLEECLKCTWPNVVHLPCRASIAKCWNVRLGSVQQAGTSPPVSWKMSAKKVGGFARRQSYELANSKVWSGTTPRFHKWTAEIQDFIVHRQGTASPWSS